MQDDSGFRTSGSEVRFLRDGIGSVFGRLLLPQLYQSELSCESESVRPIEKTMALHQVKVCVCVCLESDVWHLRSYQTSCSQGRPTSPLHLHQTQSVFDIILKSAFLSFLY